MKLKVILLFWCSLIAMLAQGQNDKTLRSLSFAPKIYYQGIEAAMFENGSFVTYHTDDGYKSFVQDVEYSSDYSSNLIYHLNPQDADLQGCSFKLIAEVHTYNPRLRSVQDVDYEPLFEVNYDKITAENGKLCLPVKITQENKEKIKYNPNHQIFRFALNVHCDASATNEDEVNVVSDYATIMFSTHEEKPLDISFKGISWWDEEGDYSIDLATHVFQVAEDKLDNIKDSIIVSGNEEHPVAIHKVETDANGITKCCVSVEDSSEKIYGYTYINVKLLSNTTVICTPINGAQEKDDNIYNILGQKVDIVTKGLYIKKGKVFIKR